LLCLIGFNSIANFSRHFFSCGASFASLVVCFRTAVNRRSDPEGSKEK
jgi:hypothetical protein